MKRRNALAIALLTAGITVSGIFGFVSPAYSYTGCGKLRNKAYWNAAEKYGIKVGSQSIWYRLDCSNDCWQVSIGGAYSGTATQCGSTNPNKSYGRWSYIACGGKQSWVTGDVNAALNAILSACR